jgi:hypothetical protein
MKFPEFMLLLEGKSVKISISELIMPFLDRIAIFAHFKRELLRASQTNKHGQILH